MNQSPDSSSPARRIADAVRRRGKAVLSKRGAPTLTFASALDDDERAIVAASQPYSVVSKERLVAIIDAVRYTVGAGVPGAFVEAGVYRGGSALAVLLTLRQLGVDDRDIYLYDTFEGMTEPTSADTSRFDPPALVTWQRARAAGRRAWDNWFNPEIFDRTQVQRLLLETGYPPERLHLVAGRVEDTIPAATPATIAVLRLDTDWYESTRHELEHLYPRLSPGGVLLIDDYGHWDGARKAVDEYFDGREPKPLLARTDYAGRMAVKPPPQT